MADRDGQRERRTLGVVGARMPGIVALILGLALLLLGVLLPATANSASLTITAGGVRAEAGTGDASTYVEGLAGVSFEYRTASPVGPWTSLGCVTNASGDCTGSANLPVGTYNLRVAGTPVGWSAADRLSWGAGSSDTGHPVDYWGFGPATSAEATALPPTVTVTDAAASYTVRATGIGLTQANAPTGSSNSNSGERTDRFVVLRDNPPLPASCGATVRLVLDTSGSIGNDAPTYAAAARSFISALAGSPTTVEITRFSNASSPIAGSPFDLSTTTGTNDALAAITNAYSSVGGGTNWDDALHAARASAAEVVVFLTDGNPTVHRTATGGVTGSSGSVHQADITRAVASANAVKLGHVDATTNSGAKRIIAVGAGPAPNVTNLAAISGPTVNDDYFVSDIAQLEATFRRIASQLCGARVHVRKYVGSTPVNGWDFAGTDAAPGVTFDPLNGLVTTAGAGADTGIARLGLNNVPATGTALRITEVVQSGFVLLGGTCRQGDDSGAGNQFPTVAAALNGPLPGGFVQLQDVRRNSDWYCTFANDAVPVVRITKELQGQPTGVTPPPFSATLTASGLPDVPLPLAVDVTQNHTATANVEHTLREDTPLPSGYELVSTVCTLAPGSNGTLTVPAVQTPGSFAFTPQAGQTVDCRIVNRYIPPTIRVTKELQGQPTGVTPPLFPATLTAPGLPDAQLPLAVDVTQNHAATADRQYTLSEDTPLPSGYELVSTVCTLAPGSNGTLTVPAVQTPGSFAFTPRAGQTIDCRIVNRYIPPTIRITKRVENGTGDPTLFSLRLNGGSPFALADGQSSDFTVAAGPLALSEDAPPAGYSFVGIECRLTPGAPVSGGGDQRTIILTLNAGQQADCIVTNRRDPAIPPPVVPPVGPPPVTPPAVTPPPAVSPAVVTQQRLARLAITKRAPARARGLERITYTIRVRNRSRIVATDVVVTDPLPAGVTFLRAIPRAQLRAGQVRVALGNLRPGQVRTIKIVVRAAADIRGRRVNIASATATNAATVRARAATLFSSLMRRAAPRRR